MAVSILLVEDNTADARLIEIALEEIGFAHTLHRVKDGVDAMLYLRREGEFSKATTPDFILLDLNLPRKDGREVLQEIRNDPALKDLLVIVLTTSENEQDIAQSYQLKANCFVTKPTDLHELMDMVKSLYEFWTAVAKLPPI